MGELMSENVQPSLQDCRVKSKNICRVMLVRTNKVIAGIIVLSNNFPTRKDFTKLTFLLFLDCFSSNFTTTLIHQKLYLYHLEIRKQFG